MNFADRKEPQIIFEQFIYVIIWGLLTSDSVLAERATIQTALVWFDSAATIIWQSAGKPQTKKPLDQNPAIRLVKALKVCVGEEKKKTPGT